MIWDLRVQILVPPELVLLPLSPHFDAGQLEGVHPWQVGGALDDVDVAFQPDQHVSSLVAETDAVGNPVQFQLPVLIFSISVLSFCSLSL